MLTKLFTRVFLLAMSTKRLSPADTIVRARIGREIRQRRKQAGWTLIDMRGRTGISISWLSFVERGIADPTVSTLNKIAVALGVPLDALIRDAA